MCNIHPQSSRENQDDWERLEGWVECLGKYRRLVVLAGPLFYKSVAF
eukprot:UN20107